MKKRIIIQSGLLLVIVIVALACRSKQKETRSTASTSKDTTITVNIKPAKSGYADVNGLKMYYEVYGEGKPIVLLHGSFMTIPLNWSHIIPMLAKNRKVIVAEMQGHGRTRDISRQISYEGMADDVSGLLKDLKIDSADILGYSMGGGIAFQVAVRHPEQVSRLVVLSEVMRTTVGGPMLRPVLPVLIRICSRAHLYKNNTIVLETTRLIFRNL